MGTLKKYKDVMWKYRSNIIEELNRRGGLPYTWYEPTQETQAQRLTDPRRCHIFKVVMIDLGKLLNKMALQGYRHGDLV